MKPNKNVIFKSISFLDELNQYKNPTDQYIMLHKFTLTRCLRIFIATFILACLFQFILIGLFGIFPNKFDFYHAIVQKQRHLLPIVSPAIFYRTNDDLIRLHYQKRENAHKLLREETDFLYSHFETKAQIKNQTLIQIFKWTPDELPYFFKKRDANIKYPSSNDARFSRLAIWPEETYHDRIVNQLMYMPENYDRDELNKRKKLKKILINEGKGKFNIREVPNGQKKFLSDNCPVNTCEIVRNQDDAETADAIIFKEQVHALNHRRSANQIWIFYTLESPSNIQLKNRNLNLINWTATYRIDSDLVTPYAKFVKYQDDLELTKPIEDHLSNKSKKVAWFVSNCGSNNRRGAYARELAKFIDVDVYGSCGQLKCPKYRSNSCFLKLKKEYKFYLSFENSNCKDYVTEKFFLNALENNIIPLVLGTNHKDYLKQAPVWSFIHVDEFNGVEETARYLNILSDNSTLYNHYFQWINTGEFIDTFFWCRLCTMLHSPIKPKTYKDLNEWWTKGQCDNLRTFKYIKPV